MKIYRVAFIGHRELQNASLAEKKLEALVTYLIQSREFVEFYVGRNGEFDILTASVIKRIQKQKGADNSSLILVLPYSVKDEAAYKAYYDEVWYPIDRETHYKSAITKRNEWMVDNSDLLLTFLERRSGGAYQALQYARKKRQFYINLAEDDFEIMLSLMAETAVDEMIEFAKSVEADDTPLPDISELLKRNK